MGSGRNIVFKETGQGQVQLFPDRLDRDIPEGHPVRIVNQVADLLDISHIISGYQGGGTSSYHPRMLIKVIFYCYLRNIYSCRRMEAAIKENIHLMWLSGGAKPSFRTLNRFRGERLKEHLKELFAEVVKLMAEEGFVSLETAFVDGTKIESRAGRYTYVWGKRVEKDKAKLQEKIASTLQQIEEAITEDGAAPDVPEPKAMDAAALKQKVGELNEKIKGMQQGCGAATKQTKALRRKVDRLSNESLPKLEVYQAKEQMLDGRNSCSKTDPGATFMRTKDDHLQNGQLKPCYNIQASSNNQVITCYTTHQEAADTNTLGPHLGVYQKHYGQLPKAAIADAAYGSGHNYHWLEENEVDAYITYPGQRAEQTKKHLHDPSKWQNLHYNEERDCLYCPMGQPMPLVHTTTETDKQGHKEEVSVYRALNCSGCPLRGACHKAKGNREVRIKHRVRKYRQKARERLATEKGKELYKKRGMEIEGVFAQVKSNMGLRRFTHWGIGKVDMEFGLFAMAHNLKKWAVLKNQKAEKQPEGQQGGASGSKNETEKQNQRFYTSTKTLGDIKISAAA